MFGFIESVLGPLGPVAQAFVALLLVVIVAVAAFLLFRLVARPNFGGNMRGKQARLAITDAATVDTRRKLVLVRRDDVEHLVMIGGPADLVVETNIRRNAPARPLDTGIRRTTGQPALPKTTTPKPAVAKDSEAGSTIAPTKETSSESPSSIEDNTYPATAKAVAVPPESLVSRWSEKLRATAAPKAAAVPFLRSDPAASGTQTERPIDRVGPVAEGPPLEHVSKAPPMRSSFLAPAEPQPPDLPQMDPAQANPGGQLSDDGPAVSAQNGDNTLPMPRRKSDSSVVEEMDALLEEISTAR